MNRPTYILLHRLLHAQVGCELGIDAFEAGDDTVDEYLYARMVLDAFDHGVKRCHYGSATLVTENDE